MLVLASIMPLQDHGTLSSAVVRGDHFGSTILIDVTWYGVEAKRAALINATWKAKIVGDAFLGSPRARPPIQLASTSFTLSPRLAM